MLFIIHDGTVRAEATEADAALLGADGKPLFDIRDLSKVSGVAVGWTANADGTYTAPPVVTPVVVVPASVTNFQAHAALVAAGLDDQAQTAITAITDATQRKLAQLAFDKGAFFRNSPLVAQLAAALNLTSKQVDDLFIAASKISA